MTGIINRRWDDDATTLMRGTEAVTATAGQQFDAQLEEALVRNPVPSLWRAGRRAFETLTSDAPRLSPEQATERFGIEGHLTFADPVLESVAAELHELKRAELRRRDVTGRGDGGWGQTLSGFAGGFLGSALDPVAIASGFIPVVGQVRYGAMLARAAGPLERAAVRAGVGAASGVVGAAAVEPLVYGVARAEQADYDLLDSAMNLVFGGVLGGGLPAVGGAIGDAVTGRFARAVPPVERDAEIAGPQAREDALRAAAGAVAEGRAPDEGVDRSLARGREARRSRSATERGRRDGVFASDLSRIEVRYEVVEAADLITSHDDDFRPNPAFPADLQPRDRSRADMIDQVNRMTQTLEPELLATSNTADSGAPIVGDDGLVDSGNGRVMAIRRALAAGGAPAQRYRAHLIAEGFDLRGMTAPVLIRRRLTPLDADARRTFNIAAQRAATQDMSAAQAAGGDAVRALTDDVIGLLKPGEITSVANADFVRAFIGRLSQGEIGTFANAKAQLTPDGLRRIERALLARAYMRSTTDEAVLAADRDLLGRILEERDDSSLALSNALLDAAPAWVRMRSAAAQGSIAPVDATADMIAAVRTIRDFRARGRPLDEIFSMGDAVDRRSPETEAFLAILTRQGGDGTVTTAGRAAVADALDRFATAAMKTSPDPDIFGTPPPDAAALLKAVRDGGPVREATPAREAAPEPGTLATTGQVREFALSALDQREERPRITVAAIDGEAADRVRATLAAAGERTAGAGPIRIDLDAGHVRHIEKQHGDPAREEARGQRAVRPDDFARLPEILTAPDAVGPAPSDGRNRNATDGVLFVRTIDDTYYVVTVNRPPSKRQPDGRLDVVSMWVRPVTAGDGGPFGPRMPTEASPTPGAPGQRPARPGTPSSPDLNVAVEPTPVKVPPAETPAPEGRGRDDTPEGTGQGDFMAALQPVLDADAALGGHGDPDLADTLAAAARAAADRTPDARRIEADLAALDGEIARATAAGRDLTGDVDMAAARLAAEDGERQAGVADAAAACLRRGLG